MIQLVTFKNRSGIEKVGLRCSDSKSPDQAQWASSGLVIDLSEALDAVLETDSQKIALSESLTDMLSVIRQYPRIRPAIEQFYAAFEAGKVLQGLFTPEPMVEIQAPIPRPPSIRDGYSFRQHVETMRRVRGNPMVPEYDQFPVYYYSNHFAAQGPGDVVVPLKALEKLDYEVELCAVIGKEGRNIPASRADEYIFGFMIMNDWSAWAIQQAEMKLSLGPAKGKDFATSFGPYLVPRDQLAAQSVASPQGTRLELQMKGSLNGRLLSSGNSKDMTWTFAQILERISYGVTVHPGEIIGSGTVGGGCLRELNATQVTQDLWVHPNDKVVIEIDHLGQLTNQVVAGPL